MGGRCIVKRRCGGGYKYPFLAIKRSTNQNPTSRLMRDVEDRGLTAALGEVCVRDWGEGESSTSAKSLTSNGTTLLPRLIVKEEFP